MPNYFYDLPEELQEMIYKEEHMIKMKEVTREVKKLTPFTRYLLLYNWQFHENVLPNLDPFGPVVKTSDYNILYR